MDMKFNDHWKRHLSYFAKEELVFYTPSIVMRCMESLIDKPIHAAMRKSPILFIHIPKNAGTTISSQLYGNHSGHHTALWYQAVDRIFFNSKHKLAIIRDPYKRFMSAYRFACAGGTKLIPMDPLVSKFIKSLDGPDELLSTLLKFDLTELMRFDPIFQPQSVYIKDRDGKLMVDDCLKLELIQNKILNIADCKIDMNISMNVLNEYGDDHYHMKEISASVDLVKSLYAKDYELYNN